MRTLIPLALLSGLMIRFCCSAVRHRCGSDPTLLWLWCSQAATALFRPLPWEPPYASGVTLKKDQKKNGDCICVSKASVQRKYDLRQ